MKRLLWGWALAGWMAAAGAGEVSIAPRGATTIALEQAELDAERVEVVVCDTLESGRGIQLRAGCASRVPGSDRTPDVVVRFRARRAGEYRIRSVAAVNDAGRALIPKWKRDSIDFCAGVQLDDRMPERLAIFAPWLAHGRNPWSLGRFTLTGRAQTLRIRLPKGFLLEKLIVEPFPPLSPTPDMAAYRPRIVPPKGVHPRVWVNPDSLKTVRENLKSGEHRRIYEPLRARALAPFVSDAPADEPVGFRRDLCDAVINKAFVYLMERHGDAGGEAVRLMTDYLKRVSFGNWLDACRDVGEVIYAASLVYDWCYDLMTPEARTLFRSRMLRMAEDLEVGYPPVRQTIVSGHGNEKQMSRDLLAMAIAVYDEDPVPYRYLCWQVLENLVPMKNFEYRSPRHNQGTNYGYLRYNCDLYAAWMMARMSGRPVFRPEIFRVVDYWTYMRLPGGDTVHDGDGALEGRYWAYPQTTLLAQAGSRSPQLKGEMMRQKSFEKFPILSLLFNDPSIPVDPTFDTLPLTIDFGPSVGGMVARTGWDISPHSSDVIAEIKGGGYHFGNHQHADSGAIQLYYRGRQINDIGQYKFYGTPYDFDFAKRSIAHSMIRVYDPREKTDAKTVNDGGIALNLDLPLSPAELTPKSKFYRGFTRYAAFGPDRMRPLFSAYSVDLSGAYGKKVPRYVRSFFFLNLGQPEHPAALILLDNVTAAQSEFKKYFQLTSRNAPEPVAGGLRFVHENAAGRGQVRVDVLLPAADNRDWTILRGAEAHRIFGEQRTPPLPGAWQASAARSELTVRRAERENTFLTVFQMTPEGVEPLPVAWKQAGDAAIVSLADRTVVCHRRGGWFRTGVRFSAPENARVMVADLAPGDWLVTRRNGGEPVRLRIAAGQSVALLDAGGDCEIVPQRLAPAAAGR